jgi:hypothetical protein
MIYLKRLEINFCSWTVSGIRRGGNDMHMPFKSQITANFAVFRTGIYSENYNQVPSRCVWGLFKFHIKRDVFWNHLSCPRSMGCCSEARGGLNWLALMFCKQHGVWPWSQLWEHMLHMLYFPVSLPYKFFDSYLLPFQCCVHINSSVIWTLRLSGSHLGDTSSNLRSQTSLPVPPLSPSRQIPG